MTILEIEERSGLPRANVRFYEKEGFLTPTRGANGYRDYSPDDLALLNRIKLLRQLKIPLEDIRAMQSGSADLSAVLADRLREIDTEQQSLDAQRTVCLELRADGAVFNTLDAEKYSDKLRQTQGGAAPYHVEAEIPKANYPWRRYFARTLDLALYQLLWYILAYLVFHWNKSGLWILIPCGLMLLIEPPLLARFGTTPGKALFGIRITDYGGDRLTLTNAIIRTWAALVRGYGLVVIPYYNLYRLYKSYKTCKSSGEMKWDEDIVYIVRDRKPIRFVAFILCAAVVAAATVLTPYAADMPKHRGNLTTEHFVENMNLYLSYHGYDWVMSPDGTLDKPENLTVFDTNMPEPVSFDIITTDGIVTGVGFKMESRPFTHAFYIGEMCRAAYICFAGAQPGMDFIRLHFGGSLNKLPSPAPGLLFHYDNRYFTELGVEVIFNFESEIDSDIFSAYFLMLKT